MHGRGNWKSILQINIADKGVKDILANFMLINQEVLIGDRCTCSPDDTIAKKNMYVAVWKTFSYNTNTVMQIYGNNIKTNGAALLHHLLIIYTGISESVIKICQISLNNLLEKVEELSYGVNKCCDYVTKMLKLSTMLVATTNKHVSNYMMLMFPPE
eukprot:2900749-Ditylum_brightwellii.AAC.1